MKNENGGNKEMGRKALALVLSMSLLWSMTVNPVLASDVENAEEVAIENAIVDSTEVEEVLPVAEVEETEVEAAVEEDTETEVTEDAVVEEAEVEETEEVEEDAIEALNGECGDDVTWELSDAGVLTISGTGEMVFDNKYSAPWYDFADEVREVVVGKGITNIADDAFSECVNLQSVKISDSVKSIGEWAFLECESLEKIVIPDSVTSIGYGAFSCCSGLKEVQLPKSLKVIDEYVFEECENLKSIEIPKGVTTIKRRAFSGCAGLDSIVIPNSVTTIGNGAFEECSSLESVVIPDSVTSIGGYAFEDCENLKDITLSKNTKEIGYGTFSGCTSLTNVKIPKGVTTIQYGAFSDCTSLKEVEIADSVKKIEGKAFYNTAMKSVTLSKNVKTLEDLAVGYVDKNWEAVAVKGFTIYGYTSTKAESYANKNAFTFKNLDEDGASSIVIVHEKSEDTYVIGSGEDLVIYCTGDFDKFVSVEMDGVLVDPSNYTAEEGSTIITFSSSYLDTLSPGKHKVTINFVDDSVSTYINIIDENGEGAGSNGSNGSSSGSYRPGTSSAAKTGDSANVLMWMILALAAAGVAGVTVAKKRKMD